MSEPDLDPVPETLRTLIDADRNAPALTETAFTRVHGRLQMALSLVESTQPPPSASASGAEDLASGSSLRYGLLRIVTAFAIGGAAGGGVVGMLSEPMDRSAIVDRPTALSTTAPPVPDSDPTPAIPSTPVRSPTDRPRRGSDKSPIVESSLSEERILVDTARTALARGRFDDALIAINHHTARFPSGVLTEEREGVRIRALLLADHRVEALDRLRRFGHLYPESPLLPALQAAMESTAP